MTKEIKRGRPKASVNNLNSEKIIAIAKALIYKNKKMPSIRQITTELNVDAMALYYYFPNKNSLMEAITSSLISDINISKTNGSWQQQITALAKSYLELLNNYPGLLETMLSMTLNSPVSIFRNKFKNAIAELKLNEDDVESALNLLVDYLHGFALAMSLDKNNTLRIDEVNKPLDLYFKGISK